MSRTTPLHQPPSASNATKASIASVPARVTRRGGVRFSAIRKSLGRTRAAHCSSALTTASRPSNVWIVQVSASTSRQWQSVRNSVRKSASPGAARACSKSASQVSTTAEIVSFLVSIRVLSCDVGVYSASRVSPVMLPDVAQAGLAVMSIGDLVAEGVLGDQDLLYIGRAFVGKEEIGVGLQPGHSVLVCESVTAE